MIPTGHDLQGILSSTSLMKAEAAAAAASAGSRVVFVEVKVVVVGSMVHGRGEVDGALDRDEESGDQWVEGIMQALYVEDKGY